MYKRKLFNELTSHLSKKEYSIIMGSRQTGKTTILKQLEAYLLELNSKVYYFTLEDFDVLNELDNHPENIFKFVPKQFGDKIFLLIDEIQYLNNPSNFLKLIYDKYSDKIKIIATGSSAFYIDAKFSDSLAGRKKLFYLSTLDFEEFLIFKEAIDLIEEIDLIRQQEDYISLKRNEIAAFLNEYIMFGGYPAVVKETIIDDKIAILRDLFNSYLKKDILESGVQDQTKFYRLVTLLSHQVGSLLNINELSNTIGLSHTAVNNYINILNKSLHISTVRPFTTNIRKELTKMPKIYFSDLGFRNIVMNSFNELENRIDKGIIIENLVYNSLINNYEKDSVKFWRTTSGDEVDFVVDSLNSKFAIEVKFNYKEFNHRKYLNFKKQYPSIPLSCVAYLSDKNSNNVLSWV
ncbi:MAG: ATP-binding protein [Bacteroidales bacterium]|nr:ATP-binding protein [Bacteroidales bacterium]